MMNLKNIHLKVVESMPFFTEEDYEKTLVAKFSGEYTTEKFEKELEETIGKVGSLTGAIARVVDKYLFLTSEGPSDNVNALFDIPLLYLIFNNRHVKEARIKPGKIVEFLASRRTKATIYDREQVYPIVSRHALITDSFCKLYSYDSHPFGASALEAYSAIYILNAASLELMEKMTTAEKLAIIKVGRPSHSSIFDLYKNGVIIEAPIKPIELLQKISKSVEKSIFLASESDSEKRDSVNWMYSLHHAYRFPHSQYLLRELSIKITPTRAFITRNENAFLENIGPIITGKAADIVKTMFRSLKGKNVNKREFEESIVLMSEEGPIRDSIISIVGKSFTEEFQELAAEMGMPPYNSNKTISLIHKYFNLETLEPREALIYKYMDGASGSFSNFEYDIITHTFRNALVKTSKEIGSNLYLEVLKADEERLKEGLPTICPPKHFF